MKETKTINLSPTERTKKIHPILYLQTIPHLNRKAVSTAADLNFEIRKFISFIIFIFICIFKSYGSYAAPAVETLPNMIVDRPFFIKMFDLILMAHSYNLFLCHVSTHSSLIKNVLILNKRKKKKSKIQILNIVNNILFVI